MNGGKGIGVSAARAKLSRGRISFRRVLAFVLATLALLTLLVASITTVQALRDDARMATAPGAHADAVGITLFFLWPVALCVVWVLGSIALIVSRRLRYIPLLLLVCIIDYIGFFALATILGTVVPLAVLIPLIFIALDIGTVYAGWRFILRSK